MVQKLAPSIGTSKKAKILYCLHETGSLLAGDFFLPGYIAECIQMAEGLGSIQKLLISKEGIEKNTDPVLLKSIMERTDDTVRWAKQIRSEEYHQIHKLSFLSEWSAQEAGNENVIAAIIETKKSAGEIASLKFPAGRYKVEEWPWSPEKCLEIAQKLDQKAKEKTLNGGWNIAERLVSLYGWLGVTLHITPSIAAKYNEASMIRNVIVHRYGRLGNNDIQQVPDLAEWKGRTVPMTRARLTAYHQAIVGIHLSIFNAVCANGWE